ncbi:hypothetical protein ACFV6F_11160 [Kitasatospora phosalacinea]|uniref:hypothetical protein n=1 Tax=Kitasatospora phosalacinea TaxID=2065 RepID=UPI0036507157
MRRTGPGAALRPVLSVLSVLTGLLLVLAGSAAAEGFEPGPPTAVVCAAQAPAERSETEQDLPVGVPSRHPAHPAARSGAGTWNGVQLVASCQDCAGTAPAPYASGSGRGAPPTHPSRRTGGATASVFQVFRC